MTIFRDARDDFEPGLPPLHPDRLACGDSIAAPPPRHRDRLHSWFLVLLYAILTVFMLAVVYGFVAITP